MAQDLGDVGGTIPTCALEFVGGRMPRRIEGGDPSRPRGTSLCAASAPSNFEGQKTHLIGKVNIFKDVEGATGVNLWELNSMLLWQAFTNSSFQQARSM